MVTKNNKGITYRDVSGTPIYDSEGNFIAGVLICCNIADRLKNEEKFLLKTQYDLLNRMIENLDLGFVRCSYPEFNIIDINQKSYNDLKQINPKIEYLSFIKGKNFFNIFTIDEEVKAKNQMEKNLKIQDEIFANISHELKTPLNVIFSTSQLFELYLKSDSLTENKNKISRGFNIMKQNCYRLTKLISNSEGIGIGLSLVSEKIDKIANAISDFVEANDGVIFLQ